MGRSRAETGRKEVDKYTCTLSRRCRASSWVCVPVLLEDETRDTECTKSRLHLKSAVEGPENRQELPASAQSGGKMSGMWEK